MRLLCITDIHGNRAKFEAILNHEPQPDILIVGGDFTDFGTPREAEDLLTLAKLYCPSVMAVAGNCDSAAIDDMLARHQVSLHRNGIVWQDYGFFGLSAMPPWRGDMYEFSEDELDQFMTTAYQPVKTCAGHVLVTHPPPFKTKVDMTSRGAHVGSKTVRKWIEAIKPKLVVCGHIHEARGTDRIGETKIVNCGPSFKGYYAVANIEEEVDVELKQL